MCSHGTGTLTGTDCNPFHLPLYELGGAGKPCAVGADWHQARRAFRRQGGNSPLRHRLKTESSAMAYALHVLACPV